MILRVDVRPIVRFIIIGFILVTAVKLAVFLIPAVVGELVRLLFLGVFALGCVSVLASLGRASWWWWWRP